jgi:hypothetical protein
MKITSHRSVSGPKSAAPFKSSKDSEFKTLLTQTLKKGSPESTAAETVVPSPSASATPLSHRAASWEQAAVSRFENLLDALTTYQKRLGDNRFSLRSLEPDLDRMDRQCQQLDALTKAVAPDSEALAFLREGLTMARIEVERFQRGDYC